VGKPAIAHTQSKPVVATGTLPAKRVATSAQVKKPGPATMVHSAAKPTLSPVPAKKVTAKLGPKSARTAAGSKSNVKMKPTVAQVPQNSSIAKVAKTEPKPPTPAKLLGAAGRRDPFVSPIRNASAVTPQSCSSGKRCLAIPELVLQGTVRDVTGKMMAVVSTSNRRTYTLRENDQVYNGSVEKITSDSIIFREFVRDTVGRETAKEVVKKMGPTS
jgi:Tfp pilus assembly protein PilP